MFKKLNMKHSKQSILAFLLMIFIIAVMLYQIYTMQDFQLDVPLFYDGGDDFGVLLVAKMLVQQPWCLSTSRLGAPFSADFYDFSSNCLNNVGRAIMKVFAMITQDAVMTVNLTYLSTFFITGIISYFVMRKLKLNCWISALLSSVFAISPYMLNRNIGHLDLTECYFVPLSILLCIWIYQRDDIFVFDKTFFKKKINWIVILFALLIANNGIAYYPFFTCFLLVVTIISKCLKTHKLSNCRSGVITTSFICLFLVISLIPSFVYKYVNGSNPIAVSRSGFMESELYGLKIFQLFMPLNGHGIYDNLIASYNENTLNYTFEGASGYLGVVGIIGFIVLLIAFFMKENGESFKKLKLLSELNIMMLLFATTSGFSAMFAFYISSMLRGYARISIFIEYVSLLALAIVLTAWIDKKSSSTNNSTLKKRCLYCLLGLLCVFSIWEGSPDSPDYQTIQANYFSDKNFISEIESNLDEGSMIYQLPYHKYPEAGGVNEMSDYHLLTGYLHSDTLKWSYGSIKGREADAWNENVSNMELNEMVSYLKEEGFSGIYIDRRAYTEDEIETLESELKDIIGNEAIVSNNGNLCFYQF